MKNIKIDENSAGIILLRGDKVLMQLRDKKKDIAYPGYWGIPGGEIEQGETLEQGAKRELKEETGYISKNPKLFLAEMYFLHERGTVKRHLFLDVYDEKQKIYCKEGQKMEFKSIKDFKGKDVVCPLHIRVMKKAIKFAKDLELTK